MVASISLEVLDGGKAKGKVFHLSKEWCFERTWESALPKCVLLIFSASNFFFFLNTAFLPLNSIFSSTVETVKLSLKRREQNAYLSSAASSSSQFCDIVSSGLF